MKSLTIGDFQSLLPGALPQSCLDIISKSDWSYDPICGAELDHLVADLLGRIATKNFSIVTPGDKSRWVRGWGENRDAFLKSGNIKDLQPKYIRKAQPLRLFGKFIKPINPDFEANWYRLFQEYIFRTQLDRADTIYEFGCGSGINVALLAQMYPERKIVGLDWAPESVEIVNAMRLKFGWNVEGRLFDFFDPDYSLNLDKNSAVFTFGALEQTANLWGLFIDYLLVKRPALCVFVEPVYEFYDPANLADYLAIRIHDARHFMKGLRGHLHGLVKDGHILMFRDRRAWFGSVLLEGYSQMIWKPVL